MEKKLHLWNGTAWQYLLLSATAHMQNNFTSFHRNVEKFLMPLDSTFYRYSQHELSCKTQLPHRKTIGSSFWKHETVKSATSKKKTSKIFKHFANKCLLFKALSALFGWLTMLLYIYKCVFFFMSTTKTIEKWQCIKWHIHLGFQFSKKPNYCSLCELSKRHWLELLKLQDCTNKYSLLKWLFAWQDLLPWV